MREGRKHKEARARDWQRVEELSRMRELKGGRLWKEKDRKWEWDQEVWRESKMGMDREYGRFGVQLLEEKEGVKLMIEERKKPKIIYLG